MGNLGRRLARVELNARKGGVKKVCCARIRDSRQEEDRAVLVEEFERKFGDRSDRVLIMIKTFSNSCDHIDPVDYVAMCRKRYDPADEIWSWWRQEEYK